MLSQQVSKCLYLSHMHHCCSRCFWEMWYWKKCCFKTLLLHTDKLNCHICDEILEGLETIDDECDVYGIHLVKIQDPQLAKRYSIKTFPALVYFRNGNPLLYEGTLYLSIAGASLFILLTLRLLMSYIYIWSTYSWCF